MLRHTAKTAVVVTPRVTGSSGGSPVMAGSMLVGPIVVGWTGARETHLRPRPAIHGHRCAGISQW